MDKEKPEVITALTAIEKLRQKPRGGSSNVISKQAEKELKILTMLMITSELLPPIGGVLTPEAFDLQVGDLKHLDFEHVEAALRRCRIELDRYPTTRQILERTGEGVTTPQDELDLAAMNAWAALKTFRRHLATDPHGVAQRKRIHGLVRDVHGEPEYDETKRAVKTVLKEVPELGEHIEWALGQIGGDQALVRMDEHNEPFMRRDFIVAYRLWTKGKDQGRLPAPRGELKGKMQELLGGKKM